jgi:hypothetical protein
MQLGSTGGSLWVTLAQIDGCANLYWPTESHFGFLDGCFGTQPPRHLATLDTPATQAFPVPRVTLLFWAALHTGTAKRVPESVTVEYVTPTVGHQQNYAKIKS